MLPGEGNDALCCTLKHVELHAAESLKYKALSYRWEASPEEGRTIWIDGCTFAVSHLLFFSMTFLRDSKIPRTIWIGAISIKQVNDDDKNNEKMVQISLVGKIYSCAYEVIIWLGSAAPGSDNVMNIIADGDVEKTQGSEFADGFAKLSARSWFSRTWILQGFVLAKLPLRIVCGMKRITSGQFLAVHAFLDALDRHSDKAKFNQGWKSTEPVSFGINPFLWRPAPLLHWSIYTRRHWTMREIWSKGLQPQYSSTPDIPV